jgi:hypothetical protein
VADNVVVPEDLKKRFNEFDRIASITKSLQKNIDAINQENIDAAGQDDVTARTYHSQVNGPTTDLSNLVSDISELFGLTGDQGKAAADVLQQGEDAASQEAGAWDPKPDR